MIAGSRPVVVLAKWLAAVTALVISLGVPAGYLYFGYQQVAGAISAESYLTAQQITQLINSNPDYWQFETIRIGEIIGMRHQFGGDKQRVVDNSGSLIAEGSTIPPNSPWPTVTRQETLYDYGAPVGKLEISYSLEALYKSTLLVALFSIAAGLVIYWGLRVLPLRSLERAWTRLSFLASHDALTGLPNRPLFVDRLEQSLSQARRKGQIVTVHSIDLDHFKDVNDTLGHAAGDSVLRQAAERMKACVRQEDTVARLSGDEFAIIQNDSGSTAAGGDTGGAHHRGLERTVRPARAGSDDCRQRRHDLACAGRPDQRQPTAQECRPRSLQVEDQRPWHLPLLRREDGH